MFSLSEVAIDRDRCSKELADQSAGALVSFEGWVRDNNQGYEVKSLEYQVYEELALSEGQKIVTEAKEKFNIKDALCYHRHGHLHLGEIAIWIGTTATHRDDAYKASRYIIDEIKLRLPMWKKEHYLKREAKWVFCRDHHTHVHFEESDYYFRQEKLVDQSKLKNAKVVVIGAGGLGSAALQALAGAGVGSLSIYDHDKVSISNLQRQFLYGTSDVGEFKVDIALKKLRELNPFINLNAKNEAVSEENILDIIAEGELILDCTDNLRTKFLIHDACFKLSKTLVSASIYRGDAILRAFDPKRSLGCLRCQYEETPSDSHIGNCNDYGVLGANVATIGMMMSSVAIDLLNKGESQALENSLLINLGELSIQKVVNFKKSDCPVCLGDVEIVNLGLEVSGDEILDRAMTTLDIRELNEIEDIKVEIEKCDGEVALYCHRGIRSLEVVKGLREQGVKRVYSLRGGASTLVKPTSCHL
ncbi:ThiF family adenylyltransferase [Halobacteriovorax marinus]|uniref:ThiF family adenylyltransferase n=1 Tax=Halobacteriovorax marinus TaxID=97084 RepID=UPI003A8E0B94